MGTTCTHGFQIMNGNQDVVEGVTLYYHNQETNTRAHHNSWNQALNLEENANMTFQKNAPMGNLSSPMDSLGNSTTKSYIICGHLLATSDYKLRKKKLLQIMPSE